MTVTPQKPLVKLMLDSGAFSAWFRGESLNLADYIKYVLEHRHLIDTHVCLDVIPGSNASMTRAQAEIEKSAAASYRNQQIMRDAGLSPIPVFHMGERFEWLEKYLKDGEGYIGISPYLRARNTEIIRWLDSCFAALTDSAGRPFVKTHGFGATGYSVITRYPWRSVDSTTWAIASGYGMVRVPPTGADGAPDLTRAPLNFYVGSMERADGGFAGLVDSDRACIEAFAAGVGIKLADLRFDSAARKALSIGYLKSMEKLYVGTLKSRPPTFITPVVSKRAGRVVDFSIIFAAMIYYHDQNSLLTTMGANNRLMSYYKLREGSSEDLELYVRQGQLQEKCKPRISWRTKSYMDFRRLKLTSRFTGEVDEQEAVS